MSNTTIAASDLLI